jgi:hypothetical protein
MEGRPELWSFFLILVEMPSLRSRMKGERTWKLSMEQPITRLLTMMHMMSMSSICILSATTTELITGRSKQMFYIVSIILLIVGMLTRENTIILSAGLFGIAGAIEFWGVKNDKGEEK